MQINRFCASGLEAVNMAAAQVMSGQADLVIGGGVESMSRVAMGSSGGAWFADPEVAFRTHYVQQGISADLIATRDGFSRDDVDAYAVESQRRAAEAWDDGRFAGSVAPVTDENGAIVLDRDEHVRPDTDMQALAALNPAFDRMGRDMGFDSVILQRYPEVERIEHVHHAGNSSGIVDGAAVVLVGSGEIGAALGLKPRARVRGFGSIGSEPGIMLTGPAPVTRKVLARGGMETGDIDLYELNEAFAAVVLLYMRDLGVPHDRINVNGGAIAMGHPARGDRRHDTGDAARRTRAPRPRDGPVHALHRGRHGGRDGDRARLNPPPATGMDTMIDHAVDGDGVATIAIDVAGRSVNVLDDDSAAAIGEAVRRAIADDAVTGVIVTSRKNDFVTGAAPTMLLGERDPRAHMRPVPPAATDLA